MTKKLQAIRGMYDVMPAVTSYWQYVEEILRTTAASYSYQEIRFPILEYTELFSRTIGAATDIVEKEMYTFADRNGDSLTLRPEGTASCVRAALQNGLLHNQIQRLYYMGPMFRHERPQKGRYRQFYQFGVEAFGLEGPDLDAELILLGTRIWEKLGITNKIRLQLNSLGSSVTRQRYREELVKYFNRYESDLDEDSKRRLTINPLRILDSKNPELSEIIANAPQLLDYLQTSEKTHFEQLLQILTAANIKYEINPHLVRGLDYYCLTVFEWVTSELGSQNAVCAGGRYDGLVTELGGRPTPAAGFALGMGRLIELVKSSQQLTTGVDLYMVLVGAEAITPGLLLAEKIRDALPNLRLLVNCGGGSFKAQFKRADKSRAELAVVLGSEEITNNQVTVKHLRQEQPQQQFTQEGLLQYLMNWQP